MAFSNLEKALALVIGLDIATPGFSRAAAKSAVAAIARATPPLAAGVGTTAATFPVTTGAALGLGALQTQPGQQLLDVAEQRGRMDRIRFEQALTDYTSGATRKTKKRKVSAYAKGIKVGMKALKASKFNGKPGKLTNAKKAFATVSKTVSALRRGKKVRRTGAIGVIAKSASKVPGIKSIKVRK